MTHDQWQQLVKAIEQRECILLLGPGVSTTQKNDKEIPLTIAFAHQLAAELKKNEKEFEPSQIDDLTYIAERYLTIPNATETDPAYQADKYFASHAQINEAHRVLASLPFYMIINASPDKLMYHALKEAGKDVIFDYYHFRKNEEKDLPEVNNKETIIYNIFGSIEDDYKSVIISERDFIKFTSKVVERKPRIPTRISSEFEDPKFYLLIGFDYDLWHLKLLFHIFKVRNYPHHAVYTPLSRAFPVSTPNKQFFEDALDFKFVDKNILQFTSSLKEHYEKTYGKNGEPEAPEHPLSVAIISHDADRGLRDELLKYTHILEKNGYIQIWHKDKISGGFDVKEETETKLKSADIILPLVSADLFSSDDIYQQLTIAFDRHQQKQCRVIPVIMRNCMWEDSPLARFSNILPEDGKKPVKSLFWSNPEDAYKSIAEDLKKIIFDLIVHP